MLQYFYLIHIRQEKYKYRKGKILQYSFNHAPFPFNQVLVMDNFATFNIVLKTEVYLLRYVKKCF